MTTNRPTPETTIQQAAGQCVKCGLCLPHCPTYVITENECESPRGRIALADALAKQQIPLTKKVQTYLDHCLTCRACEAVCPAQVPYGELIDNTRALMAKTGKTTKVPRSLAIAIKYPTLFRVGAYFLHFCQRINLLKPFRFTRLVSLLPSSIKAKGWQNYYPAQISKQGHVALFTGCINQMVDQATLHAAIRVLTACGYDVSVPPSQRCCGALYQHTGEAEPAQKLMQQNSQAFDTNKIDAIITFTSGCAAVLQEYADKNFNRKVMDISHFLTIITWPNAVCLTPLPKKAVLHTPCTLKNVVKQADAPAKLLQKIPELQVVSLAANTTCCGAAGLYMIEHPAMADTLVEKIVNQICQINPDYLVTSNIGCALHIHAALRKNNPAIKVIHPISLLAEQLFK